MDKSIAIKLNGETKRIPHGLTINEIISQNAASSNSTSSASSIIAAKVDGKLSDLSSRILNDCEIELLSFDSADGKHVFWHSSAHVLGNALVNLYNCKLVNGPPIEEGFYYDIDISTPISTANFEEIEREMKKIIKDKVKFEKEELSKNALLDLYKDNEYKQYFINKNVGDSSTIYKNGKFFDLCQGPHLNNTGYIKAIKLIKTSSVYFLNNSENASLQRVYAITFPSKELLKEYEERIRRAEEMNHRKIGKDMNLFFFHKYSPGSCFWLPEGAHIYNVLISYIKEEYRKRGFKEVITPNIFSTDLWKQSGHYENYKENIYMLENEEMALKPMNCPGHCLMFGHLERSFKELPLRFADFGVLHRNELSGALSGLTRVRRFQQDDAHIFCMQSQIATEVLGCLDFLKSVYGILGFKYELLLSTRPEKYLGKLSEWDEAESSLKSAITNAGLSYTVNEGDGAFYGPKIDIILQDAFGRKIQCATVQLDFQLPQRFELEYTTAEGVSERPVIIHRAILGSIERMVAILLEQYGKKIPFWLSPRQIAIISVFCDEYAMRVKEELVDYEVKVFNTPGMSLNKRIRCAAVDGYRIVLVLGKKEEEKGEVNLRIGEENRVMTMEEFRKMVGALKRGKIEMDEYLTLESCKI